MPSSGFQARPSPVYRTGACPGSTLAKVQDLKAVSKATSCTRSLGPLASRDSHQQLGLFLRRSVGLSSTAAPILRRRALIHPPPATLYITASLSTDSRVYFYSPQTTSIQFSSIQSSVYPPHHASNRQTRGPPCSSSLSRPDSPSTAIVMSMNRGGQYPLPSIRQQLGPSLGHHSPPGAAPAPSQAPPMAPAPLPLSSEARPVSSGGSHELVGNDGVRSYQLIVGQQPNRARMCGFGDKV